MSSSAATLSVVKVSTYLYKVDGDSNNNGVSQKSISATIGKANASITQNPSGKSLTYNGSAQTLINAGTASGGTMMYAVTTTNSKPSTGYSNTLPTGTNAGTYYVWYYVAGDSNHKDTDVAGTAVSVSIGKKALTITAKAQTVIYGTDITKNTSQITSSGLCNGHSVTAITLTQSRFTAGTGTITPSAATVKDGNSYDVTANYNITYATGVLTINNIPEVGMYYWYDDTYTKTYDGHSTLVGYIAYVDPQVKYAIVMAAHQPENNNDEFGEGYTYWDVQDHAYDYTPHSSKHQFELMTVETFQLILKSFGDITSIIEADGVDAPFMGSMSIENFMKMVDGLSGVSGLDGYYWFNSEPRPGINAVCGYTYSSGGKRMMRFETDLVNEAEYAGGMYSFYVYF